MNQTRKIFTTVSIALFLLSSCREINKTENKVVTDSSGVWEQVGYGRIIKIEDSLVQAFDSNSMSCVPFIEIPLEYLPKFSVIQRITEDSLYLRSGINQNIFTRLQGLPELCQKVARDNRDPLYNFDVLWHTFDEHYAYFEERQLDWTAFREGYRHKITPESSDLELFLVLEEMLDAMDDGHVDIQVPESLEEAYTQYGEEKQKADPILKMGVSEMREAIKGKITERYLDTITVYNKGLVRWGPIEQHNVVYIQINSMDGFADYSIDPELSVSGFYDEYYERADEDLGSYEKLIVDTGKLFNSILDSYAPEAYILDIRFNGGGADGVAIEIMNHFTKDRTMAFSKKARNGNGFTPAQEVYLEPAAITFTGPVYVLTSSETASAAEIMTLCAQALPNVTLIGSATEGVFSDILEKKLPNGWIYGLSNEVYLGSDGINYESKGIPPGIILPYVRDTRGFYEGLFKEQQDAAIEAAISAISK